MAAWPSYPAEAIHQRLAEIAKRRIEVMGAAVRCNRRTTRGARRFADLRDQSRELATESARLTSMLTSAK